MNAKKAKPQTGLIASFTNAKINVKFVVGLIASLTMASFILGLAYSISTGFAGFWGGLPFWVISVSVLAMVCYDFWDECLHKNQ